MEGWIWKALCNEAPFRFGKNLASSGIRTRDPEVGSANRSATRTLQSDCGRFVIKKKNQTNKSQSFKLKQDFQKVHMRRFLFRLIYVSPGFRCRVITGSLMRLYYPKLRSIYYPKLRSMTQLLSHDFFHCFLKELNFDFYLSSLQLLCSVEAVNASPYINHSAIYILFLVLWNQREYSEKLEINDWFSLIFCVCVCIGV